MTKKKHQSIVSLPKIVTIVTFTVLAVLVIDFGRKAVDSYHVQRQVEWLREQVAVEQQRNEALQERLEHAGSDAYVEKIARERLKMVKPGENAVVVVSASAERSSVTDSTPLAAESQREPNPYWQRWANLLLGSDY